MASNPFVSLLGPTLLTKDENGSNVSRDTQELLEGKEHVMIYFSAHWCPPCRGYTPTLSSAYTEKSVDGSNKGVVIFVSSDRDQEQFNEYYDEMSFFALPYDRRDLHKSLSTHFNVSGIPTLIVLDAQANLKEANARNRHNEFMKILY